MKGRIHFYYLTTVIIKFLYEFGVIFGGLFSYAVFRIDSQFIHYVIFRDGCIDTAESLLKMVYFGGEALHEAAKFLLVYFNLKYLSAFTH